MAGLEAGDGSENDAGTPQSDDTDTGQPITIFAAVDSPATLKTATLESSDCLLTCDRDVIAAVRSNDAIDDTYPLVYVLESDDSGESDTVDTLLEDATDVLTQETVEMPAVLAHRLRRALAHTRATTSADTIDSGDSDQSGDNTDHVHACETLRELHDATQTLLSADSTDRAAELLIAFAAEILGLEAVLYRYDDRANELSPQTSAAGLDALVDSLPQIHPETDLAWTAFIEGQVQSVTRDEHGPEPFHPALWDNAQSGLYLPLGSYGVLVSLSRDPARYDEGTIDLATLFADTAESALEQHSRAHSLRERERELTTQNERLERRHAIDQLRSDIETILLGTDSRSEIEQAICDRCVDIEACSMAWLSEPTPGGTQLQSRAIAGRERAYLDTVAIPPSDDAAGEPAGRVARTESPVYIENVAANVHDGEWRGTALSSNYQSVIAVPLIASDYLYGVLALYGDRPAAFDEPLRSLLSDLATTIAQTIDSVTRATADQDTPLTELELEIQSGSVLSRIASQLATPVELAGTTTDETTPAVVFIAVDCPLEETTIDRIRAVNGVATAAVISDVSQRPILQVTLESPSLGGVVDTYGGSVRELVATPETTTATVVVPDTVDVRTLLTELERRNISHTLLARRERSSDDLTSPASPSYDALLEALTDRQREVVQTAYHGGFFDWPRETTGEAIAESLDISSPAFHKHVRSAEWKLFSRLFDDRTRDG
ncbi:GAF domain-containing protein [Natronolimnobius sp. AArcel1]|uniref:GAF domain-containing protein n=1 Tax=Natronolimnobius sp. AArcel1 TaxID=1679093 RepID=UPI0013EAADF5|nr:GAF domain-containing protein [Natronolimnobius sp. AArcel1]NGM69059.1 GAF domain-containing protein [Natronolimnobius sp. AArcel1]